MKDFFKYLDFTFGTKNSDIKPSKIVISEDDILSQKLISNVYVFDSPEQTNSSFYVITIPLSDEELFELRRYIWNENKYDLYFLAEKLETNFITSLYYAKTNPRESELKIASFSGNEKDNKELEKIRKWNFDSGAFWLAYSNFLDTVKKHTRIDKELIEQLKKLKVKLQKELTLKIEDPDEIVQALIDRTLFIKFLEDKHIINSFFYNFHFSKHTRVKDIDFGYKTLLNEHDIKNINKLFDNINKLFNNVLFKKPTIENKYLSEGVLDLIYKAISRYDWNDNQLSLFDFRFDVIPIEFISHIYEVFLESNQLDEGIYYTPDKLAHLIIDDTIINTGTVLDPTCGSGMFLVLAFRKLLEYNPAPKTKDIYKIIEHKNKLLKEFIFGIEKENAAWRLTVFSLYLEILKGIPADEIKQYIKQNLKNNSEIPIFPPDFSDNIINRNALEVKAEKIPHKGKFFDYIIGNPPFLEIKPNSEEISFINDYSTKIDGKSIKAKDIIGHNQISQAFMLKIKDWDKPKTRFGFVQNSSNFYNEKSADFQKFFFKQYQIENFYELSRVKDILFRKAKESVVVTIFNNQKSENNTINYYPVKMGIFSETFDLLIIQEDKKIEILQNDILNEKVVLRDYLIGNEYDFKLLIKLSNLEKLVDFLLIVKNNSFLGLSRISDEKLKSDFKISDNDFNVLSKTEKVKKHEEFAFKNYLKSTKSNTHNIPYIYQPENKIKAFSILGVDGYINKKDVNKQNFQRPRNSFIYEGGNIIFNRFGKRIEASFVSSNLFFSNLIYGIKLQNENYYHLFTAILNSDLVNFYLSLKYRKRIDDNFANLDTKAIKNIPIPKNFDEILILEISEISQQLTEGKLKYEDKIKEKLNELIYDLYDLGYLERQRIKDFFANKKTIKEIDLSEYKEALTETIELHFENKPEIESCQGINLPFGLVVTAIYFNKAKSTQPTSKKKLQYAINEILKTSGEKFLAMSEKVYGKDCIYIIKNNSFQNWTTTKAFEDGQEILKSIR